MNIAQSYIPQFLSICFCQTFLSMPPGCRRQIVHRELGMKGEKSIGNIRAEGANKGSNSCHLRLIKVARYK